MTLSASGVTSVAHATRIHRPDDDMDGEDIGADGILCQQSGYGEINICSIWSLQPKCICVFALLCCAWLHIIALLPIFPGSRFIPNLTHRLICNIKSQIAEDIFKMSKSTCMKNPKINQMRSRQRANARGSHPTWRLFQATNLTPLTG